MSHITTNGFHRLYQQACRLACAAINRGDHQMADRFRAVIHSIERAMERRGVSI